MDLTRWFEAQLQASAEGFVWSVEQVLPERQCAPPPGPAGGLGEWSAARHAFHLLYYEREAALPLLQEWPRQPFLTLAGYFEREEAAWASAPSLPTILEEFRTLRTAQLALIREFGEAAWEEAPETAWGHETLRWIVAKTYQHTLEHANDALRLALFWDRIANLNRCLEADKQARTPA